MSDTSIVHSRKAPPEWSSLLEQTSAKLATSDPYTLRDRVITDEVIEPMFEQICAMDNEPREEVFYFALGGVMCGMAREAQDPMVRNQIVDQSSDALVRHHFDTGAGRHDPKADLGLVSLRSWSMAAPVTRLARKVHEEQQPAIGLLGNILDRAVHHMRRARNPQNDQDPRLLQFQHRTDVEDIVKRTPIADTIGENAFVTSVALIRRALGFNSPKDFVSLEAVAPDEASIQTLKDIDLRKVAVRMASIRQDEFVNSDTFYSLLDLQDGQLVFRKENLADTPPDLALTSAIAHERRLRCPAIGASLIPLAAELTPRIIVSAIEKLEIERTSPKSS